MKLRPVIYKVSKTLNGKGNKYGSIISARDRRKLKGANYHIFAKDAGNTNPKKRGWTKIV